MHICMYVCMHICMYVCTCIRIYMSLSLPALLSLTPVVFACINRHAQLLHACTYTSAYTHAHIQALSHLTIMLPCLASLSHAALIRMHIYKRLYAFTCTSALTRNHHTPMFMLNMLNAKHAKYACTYTSAYTHAHIQVLIRMYMYKRTHPSPSYSHA
jgi:hypothetical protein